MRTILGPPATALGRRGIALERGAMVTLRRDAYATPPGPTLGLAIGERTTYRPGAWLLDTFERDALGETYAAWGGAAGLLLEAGGVTAAVGPVGMVTHPRELPRDAWAAIQIGALSGDAEVGLLLRAAVDTADGYWITATPALTVVERLDAGVATGLASVATPWRAGELLRAVWAWDGLRVYRDTILVAQVTDGSRLLAGRAGFTARRGDAGAHATIAAFLGGEARQEWLGAGLDLGDVQRALGQPATFDLTLSNVAPMGGADRFAALLRHAGHPDGPYDLDRGTVRVLTVVDGLSPPLTAGLGVIDGATELTEDRVRLACRGHDAFLTPQLAAGPVTYLPGPPPGGLTPLPADPCAPSTPPVIVPGAVPPEPTWPGPPAAGGPGPGAGAGAGAAGPVEGLGPEAPPAADSGEAGAEPALLGAWRVVLDYALELGAGDLGEDLYVGTTTVDQYPLTEAYPTPLTMLQLDRQQQVGSGSAAAPQLVRETLWYRGPDIGATELTKAEGASGTLCVQAQTGGVDAGIAYTVAFYHGASIHTEADLAALRPKHPGELTDPMPPRYMTLRAGTAYVTYPVATCAPDTHVPAHAAYLRTSPAHTEITSIADIGLVAVVGPQLVRMEIETAPVGAGVTVTVRLLAGALGPASDIIAGSGPCGAGTHHFHDDPVMSGSGSARAA